MGRWVYDALFILNLMMGDPQAWEHYRAGRSTVVCVVNENLPPGPGCLAENRPPEMPINEQ